MSCRRIIAAMMCVVMLLASMPIYATGQQKQQNPVDTLLVWDTKETYDLFSGLLAALDKGFDSISAAEYQKPARSYKYYIIAHIDFLQDALDENGRIFMVGHSFVEAPETKVTAKRAKSVAYQPLYHEVRGLNEFADEMILIEEYIGDPYGSMLLSDGSVYPYGVINGRRAYAPNIGGGVGAMILGEMVKDFYGVEEYGFFYAMIDDTYPFSDLDRLMFLSDLLYQRGITFIVRVMPVYDNTTYPAYQRYAKALRYARARGGTIVMHKPLERPGEMIREPLDVKMQRALDALEENGLDVASVDFSPYPMALSSIMELEYSGQLLPNPPVDVAVTFNLFDTQAAYEEQVEKLASQWLPLTAYRSSAVEGSVFHEDEVVEEEPAEEEFVFRDKGVQTLVEFFKKGNVVLGIIIVLCIVISIVLVYVGTKVYRRKFLK